MFFSVICSVVRSLGVRCRAEGGVPSLAEAVVLSGTDVILYCVDIVCMLFCLVRAVCPIVKTSLFRCLVVVSLC